MARYRKKPVEVEAFRLGYDEPPEWAISVGDMFDGSVCQIATLEGVMIANKGDYVIKGVQGELYPCKPDIFEQTYDKVSDDCGPAMISASVKRFRLRDGHTVPEKFSARLKDCIIVGLDADGPFIEQRNEGADWDFARFWVYDNEFCQPYTPFYDALNGKPVNEFCAEVVERYNEVMSSQGWLEEVDAE